MRAWRGAEKHYEAQRIMAGEREKSHCIHTTCKRSKGGNTPLLRRAWGAKKRDNSGPIITHVLRIWIKGAYRITSGQAKYEAGKNSKGQEKDSGRQRIKSGQVCSIPWRGPVFSHDPTTSEGNAPANADRANQTKTGDVRPSLGGSQNERMTRVPANRCASNKRKNSEVQSRFRTETETNRLGLKTTRQI